MTSEEKLRPAQISQAENGDLLLEILCLVAFTSNRTACNHNLLTVSIGAGRRKSCSHALRFGL